MAKRQKLRVCIVALVMLVSNYAMADTEQLRSREREAKQLNEPEQKYDLELSFPVDSDEATNLDGRRARIDSLIQEILSNEALVSEICIKYSDIFFQPSDMDRAALTKPIKCQIKIFQHSSRSRSFFLEIKL